MVLDDTNWFVEAKRALHVVNGAKWFMEMKGNIGWWE